MRTTLGSFFMITVMSVFFEHFQPLNRPSSGAEFFSFLNNHSEFSLNLSLSLSLSLLHESSSHSLWGQTKNMYHPWRPQYIFIEIYINTYGRRKTRNTCVRAQNYKDFWRRPRREQKAALLRPRDLPVCVSFLQQRPLLLQSPLPRVTSSVRLWL